MGRTLNENTAYFRRAPFGAQVLKSAQTSCPPLDLGWEATGWKSPCGQL